MGIVVAGHCWGTDTGPLLREAKRLRSLHRKRREQRRSGSEKVGVFGDVTEKDAGNGGEGTEEEDGGNGDKIDNVNDGDEGNAMVGFDLILMADTLWLGDQHDALLQSCKQLLRKNDVETATGLGPKTNDGSSKKVGTNGRAVEGRDNGKALMSKRRPRVIFSFQNHVDNAPIFIQRAESSKWGFQCRELAKVGWGGRKWPDDFDVDDEEAYGPVNIWEMYLPY